MAPPVRATGRNRDGLRGTPLVAGARRKKDRFFSAPEKLEAGG